MKTLDEVIDDFEKTCDLERRCEGCSGCLGQENGCPNDGAESIPDALFYLKEFQGLSKMWNDKLDKEQANPALTWDELKGMEGKPVWVEYESCNRKAWAIVDCFYTDAFQKVKMNVALPHDYWNLEKEMMGMTWQAYRKERK